MSSTHHAIHTSNRCLSARDIGIPVLLLRIDIESMEIKSGMLCKIGIYRLNKEFVIEQG